MTMRNRRKEPKCSRRKVLVIVGLLVVTVVVIAVLLAVFLRHTGEESCPPGQTQVAGRVLSTARIPVTNVKISTDADPDIILGVSDNEGLYKVCLTNITDILRFSRQGYVTLSDSYEGSPLNIELQPYVPLYIRRHPVAQSLVVGWNATLCCEATGSPSPDFYVWSMDGSVLKNTTSGELVLSELQTSDSGQYRCSAVNNYNIAKSQLAALVVKENPEDFCPSLPLPNLQPLPADTTLVSNGEAFYDAGTCGEHKCGRPSGPSKCDEDGIVDMCCGPTTVEKRNFEVNRSGHTRHNIELTVVTKCGCKACQHEHTTIYGYVISSQTNSRVEQVKVLHSEEIVGETGEDGHYSLQVKADIRRVVIRFLPSSHHMEISKVIHIPVGIKGGLRHDVTLPQASAAISLNSLQENNLNFNGQEGRHVGSVVVPANSFYSEEGKLYSGLVKAFVSTIDTSDPASYSSAPSDLSIIGSNGDEMGLSSYGMIGMVFKDKHGRPLNIAVDVRIEVPEDVVGEEDVKLWSLNPETGYWEYLADLELGKHVPENRKRRQSQRFFVTRTGIPANRVWLNLDKPFPICYVKVRAFRDDQMNEMDQMDNVEVILLTENPTDSNRWARYTTAVASGRNGACISSLCDTEGSMSGSIFARHVGGVRSLKPAEPRNHSTGLDDERLSKLQYMVDDYAIRTKLDYSNGAPFYFRDRSTCVAAKYTDPHFRFFYEDTHEDCHYEVDEHLTEPDLSLIGTDDELENLRAFYPKADGNYEVCYIKVAMGDLFLIEMETDEATGAFMTTDSYAGSIIPWHRNTSAYQHKTFGTRESCFLGNHACMEYKKSGLSYDGKTTILTDSYSRLFYKSSQRECKFSPNEQIRADFPKWEYAASPIPERMQNVKYGFYCAKHPVLQEAKDMALGHCYAGSETETSLEMYPKGEAFTYCNDECKSSPCINGGICHTFQQGYECECPQDYPVGYNCEDRCATQPCMNNATCHNPSLWSEWGRPQKRDIESQTRRRTRQVAEPNDEFYCQCQDNYQGLRCEEYVKFNMCWGRHKCGDGQCTSVGFDYECDCPAYYYGHQCQVRSYEDPCSVLGEEWYKPVCENGGTCTAVRNTDGQYEPSCVCASGYEGRYCHLRVEWKDDPCSNPRVRDTCVYGECHWDAASDKLCECNEGYTGPTCEQPIVS